MSNVSHVSSINMSCNWCGGAHLSGECTNMEQAQFVSNYNHSQNDPYSAKYNAGWRNHPNFSWRDQGTQNNNNFIPQAPSNPPGFQRRQPQQDNKPAWELAIEKLANATSERFIKLENKVDQLATSNKNIEIQIGQLANAINSRSQESLPSKTYVNPKEQCNAVTLRNYKESDEVNDHSKVSEDEDRVKNKLKRKMLFLLSLMLNHTCLLFLFLKGLYNING
ncbi:UDP-3-O-acylglucosamine N-acyltransferase [Bienertia sinuspersici]